MGAEKETGTWGVVRALGDTTGDSRGHRGAQKLPAGVGTSCAREPSTWTRHPEAEEGHAGGLSAAVSELLDLRRFPDGLETGRAH